MKTSLFHFDLPNDLIAEYPTKNRDGSRLMILDRKKKSIQHSYFNQIQKFLPPKSLLVLNNSKVIPARFFSDDNKIELLKLAEPEKNIWKCMVKPGKKLKLANNLTINSITGTVIKINELGERFIKFEKHIDEKLGHLALPPYIKRDTKAIDDNRYQTVYAEKNGSIASPTAGLHITKDLLSSFNHCFVTLHVGRGTFQPVQEENIQNHKMHSELAEISLSTASQVNKFKKNNKKIIAVGTTSTRTLESCYENDTLIPQKKHTDIFIYPPYNFKCVDCLITNFHLPSSTLIMLVSAFANDLDFILKAYKTAVKEKYRFYSYGDSMLIL